MEYRSLGRTGVMISPIGLGSDNFGDATPAKDAENIINRSLEAGINYVAVIASQKKAGLIKDHLKENNVSDELFARFHSPVGLDLNAQTAEEIGLSIMSEIVMHRNSGSGEPMGN